MVFCAVCVAAYDLKGLSGGPYYSMNSSSTDPKKQGKYAETYTLILSSFYFSTSQFCNCSFHY